MEEETGRPPGLRHAWRGRKLWKFVCAASIAAVMLLVILWALPNPAEGEEKNASDAPPSQEIVGSATEESAPQEQSRNPDGQAQEGDEQGTAGPGTQEGAPGMVVQFPDPAGGDQEPPSGGYDDVYGHWVLDMAGSSYGLTNCHIYLEEDGTISSPPEYAQAFEITASEYRWESGSDSFTAFIQLNLKMAVSPEPVAVSIELTGTVSGSCEEISGEFDAVPQDEVYAPYSQQGDFNMHR